MIHLCNVSGVDYQLCTLTPCLGYPGMNQTKENLRKEINQWLLDNYRQVWDFSKIVGKLLDIYIHYLIAVIICTSMQSLD